MDLTSANFDDNDDLFYFESDHLALKGNKEYSELLKTIFILEAQRSKALKDYDKVVELHKQALDDPYSFIQKLKTGQDLGIPEIHKTAEIPNIHWSKYRVPLPQEAINFINKNKKGSNSENTNFEAVEKDLKAKSATYNKSWTTEEQRRLEELLGVYPPEPIEFHRYKKIAAALGNRTVQQVSSRVQKYFLKLYKAGLPIPGRVPKHAERSKRSKLHTHQRHNHYLFKPTTFFPQLDIPVVMNEAEQFPGPSKETATDSSFGNYLIPDAAHLVNQSTEQPMDAVDCQLQILRQVRIEKQNENNQAPFLHLRYKCDYCSETPISGTRWNCQMCKEESIDFCSDCVISQMYSGNPHPFSHKLKPVRYSIKDEAINDSSNDSTSGSVYDSSNLNLLSTNENSSESENECENLNSMENSEQEDNDNQDGNHDDVEEEYESLNEYEIVENYDEQTSTYDSHNHNVMEIDRQDLQPEMSTETQDVAYSYLHSNLLLDDDTH